MMFFTWQYTTVLLPPSQVDELLLGEPERVRPLKKSFGVSTDASQPVMRLSELLYHVLPSIVRIGVSAQS